MQILNRLFQLLVASKFIYTDDGLSKIRSTEMLQRLDVINMKTLNKDGLASY